MITIGFSELEEAEAEAQLRRIGPDQQRRHDKIDAVVEADPTRQFYVQICRRRFHGHPETKVTRERANHLANYYRALAGVR